MKKKSLNPLSQWRDSHENRESVHIMAFDVKRVCKETDRGGAGEHVNPQFECSDMPSLIAISFSWPPDGLFLLKLFVWTVPAASIYVYSHHLWSSL